MIPQRPSGAFFYLFKYMKTDKTKIMSDLKRLCLEPGIAGNESDLSLFILDIVKKINIRTCRDKFGNIVSVIGNRNKSRLKVVIEAHIDEFGFSCSCVNDKLLLNPLGNICDIRDVEGAKVFAVETGEEGFIRSGHLILDNDTVNLENMGSPFDVSFMRQFSISRAGLIKATALDNRVGCALLVELIRWVMSKSFADIHFVFVFSVGEETRTSRWDFRSNFDFGIVVDAAYAKPVSFPKNVGITCIPTLGRGCAVQHSGEGFVIKRRFIDELKRIALESNIPVQDEVPPSGEGYTNFTSLKKFCGGNGVVVNVPVRNQHRSISEAKEDDIVSAVELLKSLIESM